MLGLKIKNKAGEEQQGGHSQIFLALKNTGVMSNREHQSYVLNSVWDLVGIFLFRVHEKLEKIICRKYM